MKQLIQKFPLMFLLALFFLSASLPFIHFPLTDGDIAHWVPVAKDIELHARFLTGIHDQAHGPLLAWITGIFAWILPSSFYLYSVFTIVLGLLGLRWVYLLSFQLFKSEKQALLSVVLASTSVAWVYLSRTPMYDWPAAIFIFGFCTYYTMYLQNKTLKHYFLAFLLASLATLSRFSIGLGLCLCYMALANYFLNRSVFLWIWESILLVCWAVGFNLPWLLGQTYAHGESFLNTFFYDNVGRYLKEPGDSIIRRDYYGFSLYVLVGALPYSALLAALLTLKSTYKTIKDNKNHWLLCAMWLPVLLVFSFSGHVKLGRYIAYVFPAMFVQLGAFVSVEFNSVTFFKRYRIVNTLIGVVLGLGLGILMAQFFKEADQNNTLTLGYIGLLAALLGYTSFLHFIKRVSFLNNPIQWSFGYAAIYGIFFTFMAYQVPLTPYLNVIRVQILGLI